MPGAETAAPIEQLKGSSLFLAPVISSFGICSFSFFSLRSEVMPRGVFLFGGDFVFCPYPGKCEYDRFVHTGMHSCSTPKCPYQLQAKALLEHEIKLLEGIRHKTPEQKNALEKLKRKHKQEFGRDKA